MFTFEKKQQQQNRRRIIIIRRLKRSTLSYVLMNTFFFSFFFFFYECFCSECDFILIIIIIIMYWFDSFGARGRADLIGTKPRTLKLRGVWELVLINSLQFAWTIPTVIPVKSLNEIQRDKLVRAKFCFIGADWWKAYTDKFIPLFSV